MFPERFPIGKQPNPVWDEWEPAPANSSRWPFGRAPSLIEILVVVSIFGFLLGLLVPAKTAHDHDYAHRFPPPVPNARNDFADVAGEYMQETAWGLLWRLSILPDGRFSFICSHRRGVACRESGSVRRIDGNLVVLPLAPVEPPMERVFRLVKWDGRAYLVPPAELEEFAEAIIQREEPRNTLPGRFYLRSIGGPGAGTSCQNLRPPTR